MEKAGSKIVILANGDFPTHPVPLQALREADAVVCCDGAYHKWKMENGKCKIHGDVVVIGDGDSLSENDKRELGDRFIHVAEQDYNDLHKAMDYATEHFTIHNSQFTILGATGRREDHTLGNIAYLATFATEHPGIDLAMVTDYGTFHAVSGSRTFASFPRQQVSLFSLTPDVPVGATGLQYPVDNLRLRLWWQGTLNSALGDSFTVSGGTLIVYLTHEAK